jgi:glycosidase
MDFNSNLKWWQREVVYQIYPRRFMDSNQDGIGDLLGGSYNPISTDTEDLFLFLRQAGTEKRLVALNFCDGETQFAVDSGVIQILLST